MKKIPFLGETLYHLIFAIDDVIIVNSADHILCSTTWMLTDHNRSLDICQYSHSQKATFIRWQISWRLSNIYHLRLSCSYLDWLNFLKSVGVPKTKSSQDLVCQSMLQHSISVLAYFRMCCLLHNEIIKARLYSDGFVDAVGSVQWETGQITNRRS